MNNPLRDPRPDSSDNSVGLKDPLILSHSRLVLTGRSRKQTLLCTNQSPLRMGIFVLVNIIACFAILSPLLLALRARSLVLSPPLLAHISTWSDALS